MMQQRFEVLCIDLFGLLVTSPDGYRFVMVVKDTASRWLELFALKAATGDGRGLCEDLTGRGIGVLPPTNQRQWT